MAFTVSIILYTVADADTPADGQTSAIAYAIVEMAKANGVNIYHYLTYLFEKLPYINRTETELEQFAQWNPMLKAEIELRTSNITEN